MIFACNYQLYEHELTADSLRRVLLPVAPSIAVLIVVMLGLIQLGRRYGQWFAKQSERQAIFMDEIPAVWIGTVILSTAAMSLYLELTIIRWQVSIIPLLAFYKNFVLLACFAGLGLGYALARRAQIPLLAVAPLIGYQILFGLVLKYGLGRGRMENALAAPVTEQLHMGMNAARTTFQYATIYFTLGVLFLLTALAFIPIGQLCGRAMTRTTNLRAYGLNLLGSLVGVVVTMVLSYLWTPPVVWFAIGFGLLLPFMSFGRAPLMVTACSTAAVLTALAWPVAPNVQQIYSPYQVIEREYSSDGYTTIMAAGHFFQRVYDLSHKTIAHTDNTDDRRSAKYYEFPYRTFGAPDEMLVVGAGTGNDVAAALRMGAKRIDAVEIDPAILAIGQAAHPEKPYSDERVTAIVNDARTHLRSTDKRYDMIVYGLLDSHSVLSQASSVRLDSFVYTIEGIREARARLTPDGHLSLSFFVLSAELGEKIFRMLTEAFDGREPVVLQADYSYTIMYLHSESGEVTVSAEDMAEAHFFDVTEHMRRSDLKTEASTDDWPFLYMPRRVLPYSYLGMFAVVIGLTLLLTITFMPGRPRLSHLTFFFLGSAFMLVETKGITELGLHFGNTWHVIGLVIVGVLLMAFAANFIVLTFAIRKASIPFALLFAALVVGYLIASGGGFPSSALGRLGAVALLTCPIFFSGIIFSTALRNEQNISMIMAINLLGASVGGVMEYGAMRFGYSSLYLAAIVLYAAAATTLFVNHRLHRTSDGAMPT